MLYVSFQSSSWLRRFFGATLLIAASAAQPAYAVMEGEAPTPISDFALTDDQIAQRCQASIALKVDLVEVQSEDGETVKVPRCVVRYEGMRTVANTYTNNELNARNAITQQSTECDQQSNCVSAGTSVANAALDAHNKMVTTSEEGRTALDSVEDGTPIGMRVASASGQSNSSWAAADPVVAGTEPKKPEQAPTLGNSLNVPQAQSGGGSPASSNASSARAYSGGN